MLAFWKSDVTYDQVWWPILGICALHLTQSAHTQQWTHTHTVNTHPEQWAAIYAAAPGEQLGVRCLAQGHLSRGIEGGESTIHSLPPPTIPAGPRLELATFRLLINLLYMYSILGRGSFCFNYCLNSAWHGGDQFVALLRWYGSPGCFDSGFQLICIFWSLVSHFPLENTP